MTAERAKGEMPFLDHLEELRWRILWSLAALVLGAVIGFYLVQAFDVLGLLKRPIAPYLPDGQLFVTRPTDAFVLTLKLAVLVGLILASPVIFSQVWKFLAPALYEHEKRYIVPALTAGLGLFIAGAVMAYLWVLPAALKFLLMFQREDLEPIITANEYVVFAVQLIVAFGVVFELPLVMVLLSALGLVEPRTFAKHRPIAVVVACVVAALVTPPDVISMVLMLGPLWILYEGGILVGRMVARDGRRRIGTAGAVLLLLVAGAVPARGQEPRPPRPPLPRQDTLARDSLRADSLTQPLDTAAARRLGLPTAPSRSFPAPDSLLQALLGRAGHQPIRYLGDSIILFGERREIVLVGHGLVEREGATLEADTVTFREADCRLDANGSPALFDQGTVLVGEGMRYNTCEHRGAVEEALTSFQQSGVTWYLRGGLEMDSASTRIYGATNDITSCDLPTPHYHFATRRVKWVSNTIMVARPAVLYVRDVPVLWLPFIFQDMRRGRRTGFLVPRFGLSDLVRPNESYRRHVSNIGFYVALNDYLDAQASLDWFDGNYTGVNGRLRYRWLDRFLSGGVSVSQLFEEGVAGQPGGRSLRLQWNHAQSFDRRTRLSADVDYATSARVVQRNTVDPFVQTAQLGSRVNFSKTLDWGTVNIGGSHSQDLSNGQVTQTLPTLSLTPSPVDLLGGAVTWSPSVSLANNRLLGQRPPVPVFLPPEGGTTRTDSLFPRRRTTTLNVATPLRIGRWNWQNSFVVNDFYTDRPDVIRLPDPWNPGDTVTRYYGESFSTSIDWSTGINLPILFGSTWKLQPSVGIANASTGGPFLLRNRFSGGAFVTQGKRLTFTASLAPTVFGFFPGAGPVTRIRHSVSPRLSWTYAPSAAVPEAYARAIDPTGARVGQRSPPVQTITFGPLSQTFEGKLRPPPGDTATDPRQARKIKLLSIQTSGIQYDLEQATVDTLSGWITQNLSNSLTSDLLPGFSLSLTHDLWAGRAGSDTARFDPFLTSVSTRFTLSSKTVNHIVGVLLGRAPAAGAAGPPQAGGLPGEDLISPAGTATGPSTGVGQAADPTRSFLPRGRGFQAQVGYEHQRVRGDTAAAVGGIPRGRQSVNFTVGFSPTSNWSASWNTLYNVTTGEFGQHVLRFERDLHRWRATFAFTKAPNGNFAFNFFISLTDQPDIQFRYDQRTVKQ